MREVNLDAVVATLDPDGRGGRRRVEAVSLAVQAIVPDIEPATVVELARDTIERGEREGGGQLPDRDSVVWRDRFAQVCAATPAQGESERRQAIDTPLRHELARWATGLPLSAAQRDVLLAVNE